MATILSVLLGGFYTALVDMVKYGKKVGKKRPFKAKCKLATSLIIHTGFISNKKCCELHM